MESKLMNKPIYQLAKEATISTVRALLDPRNRLFIIGTVAYGLILDRLLKPGDFAGRRGKNSKMPRGSIS